MLHGIIYARHAQSLDTDPQRRFRRRGAVVLRHRHACRRCTSRPTCSATDDWDDAGGRREVGARPCRRAARHPLDRRRPGPRGGLRLGLVEPATGVIGLRNPGSLAQTLHMDLANALEFPGMPRAPGKRRLRSAMAQAGRSAPARSSTSNSSPTKCWSGTWCRGNDLRPSREPAALAGLACGARRGARQQDRAGHEQHDDRQHAEARIAHQERGDADHRWTQHGRRTCPSCCGAEELALLAFRHERTRNNERDKATGMPPCTRPIDGGERVEVARPRSSGTRRPSPPHRSRYAMKIPLRAPIKLPSQPNASAAGKPTNCVISRAAIRLCCGEAE